MDIIFRILGSVHSFTCTRRTWRNLIRSVQNTAKIDAVYFIFFSFAYSGRGNKSRKDQRRERSDAPAPHKKKTPHANHACRLPSPGVDRLFYGRPSIPGDIRIAAAGCAIGGRKEGALKEAPLLRDDDDDGIRAVETTRLYRYIPAPVHPGKKTPP